MNSVCKTVFVLLAFVAVNEGTTTFDEEFATVEGALADFRKRLLEGRPKDCSDLYFAGQTHSGVYNIYPFENRSRAVSAYCDMETDGGGWTVIQRRGQYGNPAYHFYRNWEDYAEGFGDPAEEYWLGNRIIHTLTSLKPMELLIQLKNHTGETLTADYKVFKVAGEKDLFRIAVGEYRGDEGADAFSMVNGAAFSTRDRENAADVTLKCADMFRGGWWYVWCHAANLNGLNLNGAHASYADGIEWSKRHGTSRLYYYSYKESVMKIRRVDYADMQNV